MKSKTASVRLPKEMYDEIDDICDDIGCTRNDWVKDALKDKLRQESSDTESKTTETESKMQEEKPRYKVILYDDVSKPQLTKVSYDGGKTWIDQKTSTTLEIPQDNSKKPQIEMVLFNGKYIPKAEVYEI